MGVGVGGTCTSQRQASYSPAGRAAFREFFKSSTTPPRSGTRALNDVRKEARRKPGKRHDGQLGQVKNWNVFDATTYRGWLCKPLSHRLTLCTLAWAGRLAGSYVCLASVPIAPPVTPRAGRQPHSFKPSSASADINHKKQTCHLCYYGMATFSPWLLYSWNTRRSPRSWLRTNQKVEGRR